MLAADGRECGSGWGSVHYHDLAHSLIQRALDVGSPQTIAELTRYVGVDLAGLADIPTSVIDIDIMIGEFAAVGRGLSARAICLLAEDALSAPTASFVMACARLDNLASQRAFAKAGFRKDREFDDVPNGPHVLMVRHRDEGQAA